MPRGIVRARHGRNTPVLTVSSVGHVAIKVKDIEATLDFYVGKLGFEEIMRLEKDGRLWIVYLRITDTQFLEVFTEGTGERAPGWDPIGYHHMCLVVPDIDRCIAELVAVGVPLTIPKVMEIDRNWQCWIEDPDGHRIELMQMADDSMQAEAIARLTRER